MITLPPGVVSLKAAWLYQSSFGLALRIGGAGEGQASRGDDGKKTEDHVRAPQFVSQSLAPFFAAKERTFL